MGCPTNSAVGRALATAAGPRLTTLTGTRVSGLAWDGSAWRARAGRPPVLSLRVTPGRAGSAGGAGDEAAGSTAGSPASSVDEKEREREEVLAG